MRVVVAGAGEVGTSIAESLADAHRVALIDIDESLVDQLTYSIDVLTVAGDATQMDVLRDAGVAEADLVIASTDDDEVNLAICGTAQTATDAFTIARVKQRKYLETWRQAPGAFGVDFMVCTDLLAAQAIVRVIGLPTARDVDLFAEGQVQMAEFEVAEASPVADKTVREADQYDALTFAGVIREEEIEIARGDTTIRAGDRIVVIGRPDSVESFAAVVAPWETTDVDDVVIAGGSPIGRNVARLLADRGVAPRIIEHDPDRARKLAEDLPDATVLEHDATDLSFLEREHVQNADVFVATLDSDERCLLASLLVKRVGEARTVAAVEKNEYVSLFEAVGIDVGVNPREVTAEEITRFTRTQRAENVAIIESDIAEVLEIEIAADSQLAGRLIRESMAELPDGIVIGAVTRNGTFITPRGNTEVQVGDHVVVFVRADNIEEVTERL